MLPLALDELWMGRGTRKSVQTLLRFYAVVHQTSEGE